MPRLALDDLRTMRVLTHNMAFLIKRIDLNKQEYGMPAVVIEAIKTLGKDNVDENTIAILRNRLSGEEKSVLLKDATDSTSWIEHFGRN